MSQSQPLLQLFISNIKGSKKFWGLKDPASDDWVVCDSLEFDDTDVMPIWSEQASATAYCADEWATYQPMAISIDDYLEFWVEDLNEDGVLLGLDWKAKAESSVEIDPINVAKAFVDYQSS
jgi:hypothetical protein